LLGAKRAVEVARRKAVDEANRARYPDQLEKREEATWNQIAAHIQKRQPNEYDKAVTLLTDLHDLSERRGQAAAFQTAVAKLRRTLRAIKKSADDDLPSWPVSIDGLSQYSDSASSLGEPSWPHGDREPPAPIAG
jgi:uncharacterized protein (DUF3084 family)